MRVLVASFVLILLSIVAMMLNRTFTRRGRDGNHQAPGCGLSGCTGSGPCAPEARETDCERYS
jgi:hypothetical protein